MSTNSQSRQHRMAKNIKNRVDSHRQNVNLASWKHLASREASSENTTVRT